MFTGHRRSCENKPRAKRQRRSLWAKLVSFFAGECDPWRPFKDEIDLELDREFQD
jgi:hypothetical protein